MALMYNTIVNKYRFVQILKKIKKPYVRFHRLYVLLMLVICGITYINYFYYINYKNAITNIVDCNTSYTKKIIKEPFEFSETEIAEIYSNLEKGGVRKTHLNNQNVAIIVPYRNRTKHLNVFLRTIHYFLNGQPINYGIFVVEQIKNQTFNKAKLMNAGFMEISKEKKWDCFIFHDVDLLPENKKNIYKCNSMPTHFSSAVDKLAYQLNFYLDVKYLRYHFRTWPTLFGGVTGMKREYFIKINGHSNEFWGWGGEDEAMGKRIQAAGDRFFDLPADIGRYQTHKHKLDSGNVGKPLKCLLKLMDETSVQYATDGLSNLNYKLRHKSKTILFTHFLFNLLEKESKANASIKC